MVNLYILLLFIMAVLTSNHCHLIISLIKALLYIDSYSILNWNTNFQTRHVLYKCSEQKDFIALLCESAQTAEKIGERMPHLNVCPSWWLRVTLESTQALLSKSSAWNLAVPEILERENLSLPFKKISPFFLFSFFPLPYPSYLILSSSNYL